MPEANTERVYWDSCLFLAYVNGEPGRADNIGAWLAVAAKGEIEIITSTLAIAEVVFAASEQIGHPLDREIEDKINRLWVPPSPVRLAEFHQFVAAEAVSLMRSVRTAGLSLKPMDAIHLATAKRLEVKRFETYDDNLTRFSQFVGIPILSPAPRSQQTSMFEGP